MGDSQNYRSCKAYSRTICDEQTPDGDIEIAMIGLRAGEKLYEVLLISNNPQKTDNPWIMKAHEDFIP